MKTERPRLLFIDFVTHYGGAQRSTVYLLSKLTGLFNVQVLDLYGVCQPYMNALEAASVAVTVMQVKPRSYFIGGANAIQRCLALMKQLPDWLTINRATKREVKRLKPDVILTNSYKSMALLWMSGVTRACPVAYYARGWYQKYQIPWLGRWFINKATAVLAVSHATAEALSQWPISKDRIHVCHTVIDFDSVRMDANASCETMEAPKKTFKILLPAQLLAAKGQKIAVDAAIKLKQQGIPFVLWLAGDIKMGVNSDFVKDLKTTVDQQGLQDEVKFLGHRSDVRALMSQAGVVILPTQTEGFPRAIWEAMILQRPVIATRAGGVTDLIEHDKTGLLVPFDDASALATGIVRLVKEPGLASRLTQQAFSHITQTYSEQKTLAQISETLKNIHKR